MWFVRERPLKQRLRSRRPFARRSRCRRAADDQLRERVSNLTVGLQVGSGSF